MPQLIVLILMFMSCTSAISSQMIGVSTVLSYDVYKTCEFPINKSQPSHSISNFNIPDINPKATDNQVLQAGHWCVAGFAIFMAAFGTMLHGVKIDLGFIYVSLTSAAIPVEY